MEREFFFPQDLIEKLTPRVEQLEELPLDERFFPGLDGSPTVAAVRTVWSMIAKEHIGEELKSAAISELSEIEGVLAQEAIDTIEAWSQINNPDLGEVGDVMLDIPAFEELGEISLKQYYRFLGRLGTPTAIGVMEGFLGSRQELWASQERLGKLDRLKSTNIFIGLREYLSLRLKEEFPGAGEVSEDLQRIHRFVFFQAALEVVVGVNSEVPA